MAFNLRGKSFLKILDFSIDEVDYLLKLSEELKTQKRVGVPHKFLKNKNVILLFQKDSTRTRSAFEVAAFDLGMGVTYFGPTGSQMGKKESIADTARVLGRMYDGIQFRGYLQSDVEDLAKYSGVPVWNGLTDDWHPTQMLADFLTMKEQKGYLKRLNFTYFGDARNNMANSYIIMAAKTGVNITIGAPKSLWPDKKIVSAAEEIAKITGSKIKLTEKPEEAAKDADVIATDVWVSMGEPDEVWKERIKLLMPYQVNKKLVSHAKKDFIFLHCLPSFHDDKTKVGEEQIKKFPELKNGIEVTDEVFESKHSKVFDEAENRLHTIKAIMLATLQ